MFASPSFYLAHKISPSVPCKRIYKAFIHCINIFVYCVAVGVCARQGTSCHVTFLAAHDKKSEMEDEKEGPHLYVHQKNLLTPSHRGRLKAFRADSVADDHIRKGHVNTHTGSHICIRTECRINK